MASGATDHVAVQTMGSALLKLSSDADAAILKSDRPATSGIELANQFHGCIEWGNLRLDRKICRAFWDGKDVGLTLGEYNVAQLLVSMAGRFVTFRAMYDCMRGNGFVAGHGPDGYRANVRSMIKRIRKKFNASDSTFDEIDNHPGLGYRWNKRG